MGADFFDFNITISSSPYFRRIPEKDNQGFNKSTWQRLEFKGREEKELTHECKIKDYHYSKGLIDFIKGGDFNKNVTAAWKKGMRKDFKELNNGTWFNEDGSVIPPKEGYGYAINKDHNVRCLGNLDWLFTQTEYWQKLYIYWKDISLFILSVKITLTVPFEKTEITIYTTEKKKNFIRSLVYCMDDDAVYGGFDSDYQLIT